MSEQSHLGVLTPPVVPCARCSEVTLAAGWRCETGWICRRCWLTEAILELEGELEVLRTRLAEIS